MPPLGGSRPGPTTMQNEADSPPRPKLLASMRTKLVAAFGTAFMVPVVVVLGLQGLARQDEAQRLVDRGLWVKNQTRDVVQALLEAQVAQASYLALGSSYPVGDAHEVRKRATEALAELVRLTADNPAQNSRVREISVLLAQNVDEIEQSLRLGEAGKEAEMLAFVRKHQDRAAFRKLRGMLDTVLASEEELLESRRATALSRASTTRTLLIVGGALAFVFSIFVIVRIRINFHALEDAHDTIAEQAAELTERTVLLERSVNELDQFAYVASHDLKAPLRGIASLASWIAEDAGDRLDTEGQQHLRLMINRVERMDALVSGILAYSRAGRTGLEAERIDHDALVREVIELVEVHEGVTVRVISKLDALFAPRVPLQQIWLNLLSNALRHGRQDDGKIALGVRPHPEGPAYFVKDDGPGIDPRFHERIFTLFQTLEARDRVEGTGIGLAVVKKLVEQQGGRVWVESEAGAGTTFFFTYPPTPRPHTSQRPRRRTTRHSIPVAKG